MSRDELTQDGIFSRAITLWQPRRGYRFGVDSVLLGIFAREEAAGARVVDLGAGVGVVSLVLAHPVPGLTPPKEIVALELQERLAALASRNVEENRPAVPVTVLRADLKVLPKELPRGSFDLVVSNPPYYPLDEGEREPDEERAIARREVAATLGDVLSAASRLARPGGALALVFPAPQLPRLVGALLASPFQLTALRPVYPRAGEPAGLLLLLARKRSGRRAPPMSLLPPLTLAEADGQPNPEVERLLRRGY